MNPLVQLKNAARIFLVALICVVVLPTIKAVTPPPDGGYPGDNTAEGTDALFNLTTGVDNAAIGESALFHNTTGTENTATGVGALFFNQTGNNNTASGYIALHYNVNGNNNTATGLAALVHNTGSNNTATGEGALPTNTTGASNLAEGFQALLNNTTGSSNIALGANAGANLTTGSNNIDIGSAGVAGESAKIRIGTTGTQTAAFIAGIHGVAVTGSTVVVSSGGQLGVMPSSERFKDEIKPMEKASEAILALKPVTFRYKKEVDAKRTPQFGLVAEDVEKVNPDLVVKDAEGRVYTVRYDAVYAMLLNEFLKEHRQVQDLKTIVAQQQKQMEALTVGLQKVSAQLKVLKPVPQTVANNQ